MYALAFAVIGYVGFYLVHRFKILPSIEYAQIDEFGMEFRSFEIPRIEIDKNTGDILNRIYSPLQSLDDHFTMNFIKFPGTD